MPTRKKQPWFKAWVTDILADAELKSVPMAARGFWIYLMCLMHNSPRRGYLMQENGQPCSLEHLAAISGCSTEEAAHLHRLLITSAVFSVSDDGFTYSRRMVRESNISEVRSVAGKKGVFAKQTRQQNASKTLEYGNDPNPLPETEKKTPIPPDGVGVQGEGKFAQAKSQQNCAPSDPAFEFTNHGLAGAWVFYLTAYGGGKKRDVAERVAESIAQTVAAAVASGGLSEAAVRKSIHDAIRDKSRNRNEWYSDFEKRFLGKQSANAMMPRDEFLSLARGDVS